MSLPYTYEDTMRRHDEAVLNWLGGLHVDYGDYADVHEITTIDRGDFPILRVFATPQRAVAKVIDLLTYSGWIAGANTSVQTENAAALRARAEKNFSVLPLPVATIYRQDPVPNLADAGGPKLFHRQCFDEVSQEWQTHPWPGSYETNYEVTFWSIKRYSEVFFREWVYSQLGLPGRVENETLLPVVHGYPWGTINQRLVFESSSDESMLEGEDARYLRFTFSFRLRTWLFRKPLPVDVASPGAASGKVGFIHDAHISECLLLPDVGGGTEWTSYDLPIESPPISSLSLNMFSIYLADNLIPNGWPKVGNATVRRGAISPEGRAPHPTLHVQVQDASDEVLLSNRVVPPDDDGRAVVLFRSYYKSTADVELVLASHDPAVAPVTWLNNRVYGLPASYPWVRVSWFALMAQPAYSLTVRGTGTGDPAVVHLSDIRLHHVRTLGKVTPSSSVPGGGQTVHTFTVGTGAYLAVVVFAGGAVSDVIDVNGDSYIVDPTVEVGLVAIFTPVATSVTITVPDSIPTDDVYVQPYLGFWEGTDV